VKNMSVNVMEAERALVEKPMLATTVESIMILNEIKSCYRELPKTLRFSKFMTELLSRVSLPLEEYDIIAGRTVDRILTEDEEKIFKEFVSHPDYPYGKVLFPSGHCTYSWDKVVEYGICGLRKIAKETLSNTADTEKRDFLTAVIEIYGAISDYMLRYADVAESKGKNELAENLRKGALGVPDSFASALQLLWIITLINCAYVSQNPTLTVGRLDQILYPLYLSDLKKGSITPKRAKEYITDYYCKHNLIMGRGEHQVGDETNSTTFLRICNFDAPQYLLLGGTDENGELAVNELTQLFAECIVPSFKNPVIVVRYVEGMDRSCPSLWKTLTGKALKSSSMMFYNDKNVTDTFLRIGLPVEDARKYAHFGCNWCSPGDNGAWMHSAPKAKHLDAFLSEEEKREVSIPYMRDNADHGWPEDLMIVMRELYAEKGEDIDIDQIYDRFFERMSDFIDRKLNNISREVTARKRRPSAAMSFTDCFTVDSIKHGETFTAGAKYHFQIQSFQMFATVADSITAIDSVVIKDKKATFGELISAVEADFEGYDHIFTLCRKAEKYGMDTPLSNYHVKRLSHRASALVIEKSRPYLEREGIFLIPCMQSDTWHLKIGELYGATPDGRPKNTPFSQNTRPSNGSCVNGLTAMLNSMLNLPADGLVSGALNLDVEKKQFEGEEGEARFGALLATYFNRGGLHAQVSAVSAKELEEAKKSPLAHKDIRVRVTGYSGVFVDICEKLQDDIIERFRQ